MTRSDERQTGRPTIEEEAGPSLRRLWRAGRTSWALLGVAGLLALLGFVTSYVALVVIAVVLALFPATLLVPVAAWLRDRGLPNALAALLAILAGMLGIAAVIGAMVPLVVAELPELTASASEGVAELESLLQDGVLGVEVGGISELLDAAREQLGEAGELAGQAAEAAMVAFEVVTGLLLMLVLLFFYLKDGRLLVDGIVRNAPERHHARLHGAADRAWDTLGSYFRGQLLVALVDAVAIGVGLLVLGVPLALPLSVLVFFGGLFPIIGAVVTGSIAVLVALADGGLTTALIVLAIVIAVQQVEGNLLEPLILGRSIHLHPLVVLLSITTGALVLGVLGAFLAVPVAAIVARLVVYLRDEEPGERELERAEATARG